MCKKQKMRLQEKPISEHGSFHDFFWLPAPSFQSTATIWFPRLELHCPAERKPSALRWEQLLIAAGTRHACLWSILTFSLGAWVWMGDLSGICPHREDVQIISFSRLWILPEILCSLPALLTISETYPRTVPRFTALSVTMSPCRVAIVGVSVCLSFKGDEFFISSHAGYTVHRALSLWSLLLRMWLRPPVSTPLGPWDNYSISR